MVDPHVYRDIFELDARGAAILEEMARMFGIPRTYTHGGVDAILKTYVSTAQARVIEHITLQIAIANGKRDINPEGETYSE